MIPLRLKEIADAVDGRLVDPEAGDLVVDGPVVTDSRSAAPGSLYVARIGEHADGHAFIGDAATRGAVAAITQRPGGPLPVVVVPDADRALGRLARAVVDALPDLRIVGVTGSSGKTSTKDLIAQLLGRLGPTVSAPGSYNSEVGVPLTVLQVDDATRNLVLEMGARGVGHIAYLTAIAPLDIAVVLNVGSAHLGEFGSREAIAVAKSELVRGLRPDGVAVLNADDSAVAAMAGLAPGRVVHTGRGPQAEVRAVDVRLDDQARARFDLVSTLGGSSERAGVALRLIGEHHVDNALSAAAVGLLFGLSVPDVAAALSEATAASRWRMEVHERADGVRIVNDAYNANPESMRAALRALASMAGGRRTWAVLGTMLELGGDSAAEHAALGELAGRLGVDRLVVVGEHARPAYDAALAHPGWSGTPAFVDDREAALELLTAELRSGDIVLVKSSRDAGLRFLGEELVADTVPAGTSGGAG